MMTVKVNVFPHLQKKSRCTPTNKTVSKWEREFNIELEKKLDNDNVTEIWCSTCKQYSSDKSSSFVTGCTSVKKESVKYHKQSVSHDRAVQAKCAAERKAKNRSSAIEEGFQKIDENTLTRMNKLFRTAYYVAKYERPFTDFPNLLQLQNLNGIEMGNTYVNDKAGQDFVSQIASSYFDDLKCLLEQGNYFSIYTDGSTDKSESEKELTMVKVLDDFYPKIKFLKLEEPPTTKAEGILSAIDKAFRDFGMPNYKQKLVGFCSDGASVMMGERKGVVKLLKDRGNADWILSVWCIAHRLELALKDAFKGTYMDRVTETLTSIYYFYKGSAKRNKEAADIASIMEEMFLKPEKANGTRWVDHKLRAISKMIVNLKVIVIHLMNYAEDNSNQVEYRAKAKGIIAKVLQYKFVWYMHFMKDLLNEIAKVSLLFQRENINVSSAVTKLQSVQVTLRNMLEDDYRGESMEELFSVKLEEDGYEGQQLRNVIPEATLETERKQLIQSVLDCMHTRFENLHADPVYLACHAFDYKNWPDKNDASALLKYGADDLKVIQNHFATLLANTGCDNAKLQEEWNDLKLCVSRNDVYRQAHPLSVWQRISQEDVGRGDYQNILKVIHLTGIYPLSNAGCERGFSTMKRIKDDWRCRLSTDTLDKLIRISIEGPKIEDFDPRPVVRRWWLEGQRTRRPNIVPYGPRQ